MGGIITNRLYVYSLHAHAEFNSTWQGWLTATVRSEGMTLKKILSTHRIVKNYSPSISIKDKLPEEKAYGMMIVKRPYVPDHINSWTEIFIGCKPCAYKGIFKCERLKPKTKLIQCLFYNCHFIVCECHNSRKLLLIPDSLDLFLWQWLNSYYRVHIDSTATN